MKFTYLVTIAVVTLSGCVTNQVMPIAVSEGDAWSGRYRLTWMEGPAAKDGASDEVFSITRTPDADPDKVVEKRRADLARWTLSPDEVEVGELRRFLPDEYNKEWGWASLYATGGIECLGAESHFFVCRVKPGTTVVFGHEGPNQEKILARTGLFGSVLHAGGFELTKLDSPP